MRINAPPSIIKRGMIEWSWKGSVATTFIDVISAQPAEIIPHRFVFSHKSVRKAEFKIDFHKPNLSVRLMSYPEFMEPAERTREIDISATSGESFAFLINPDRVEKPLGELVFELLQGDQVVGELKSVVIVLEKLKSYSKGEKR